MHDVPGCRHALDDLGAPPRVAGARIPKTAPGLDAPMPEVPPEPDTATP